jgi:hypothetical protein
MVAALVLDVPVAGAAVDPPVDGFSDHCLILCTALSKLLVGCQRPSYPPLSGWGGSLDIRRVHSHKSGMRDKHSSNSQSSVHGGFTIFIS